MWFRNELSSLAEVSLYLCCTAWFVLSWHYSYIFVFFLLYFIPSLIFTFKFSFFTPVLVFLPTKVECFFSLAMTDETGKLPLSLGRICCNRMVPGIIGNGYYVCVAYIFTAHEPRSLRACKAARYGDSRPKSTSC